jgi:hypothetical protein
MHDKVRMRNFQVECDRTDELQIEFYKSLLAIFVSTLTKSLADSK